MWVFETGREDEVAKKWTVAKTAEEIKIACIGDLEDMRRWYAQSMARNGVVWMTLNLSIIALSATTTIAVALGLDKNDSFGRVIVAAMPALVTLFSSILVQFRTRETWQLREMGRIEFTDLINRARFIPTENYNKTVEDVVKLLRESQRIERVQATGFFSYLSQKSDPSNGPAKRQRKSKKSVT
jgi:hypothetical protein